MSHFLSGFCTVSRMEPKICAVSDVFTYPHFILQCLGCPSTGVDFRLACATCTRCVRSTRKFALPSILSLPLLSLAQANAASLRALAEAGEARLGAAIAKARVKDCQEEQAKLAAQLARSTAPPRPAPPPAAPSALSKARSDRSHEVRSRRQGTRFESNFDPNCKREQGVAASHPWPRGLASPRTRCLGFRREGGLQETSACGRGGSPC